MQPIWIIAISAAIFIAVSVVLYKIMSNYVHESYGKKWLTLWGNKLYFWQSLLFSSMLSTALIMYLLKWTQVLNF